MNDLANAEPALLARLAASAPPVPAWFDVEPTRPKPERIRTKDLELPDPAELPERLRRLASRWLKDTVWPLSETAHLGSDPKDEEQKITLEESKHLRAFEEAAEDEWHRRTQRNVAREVWDDEQKAAKLFAWRRYFAGQLYRQLFDSDTAGPVASLPWDEADSGFLPAFGAALGAAMRGVRTAEIDEREDGSPHDSDAWEAQHLRRSMHAMEATLQKIHSLAGATPKEPDLRASVCAMLARGALDELRRIRSKPDTERGPADWETYLHDLTEVSDAEDGLRAYSLYEALQSEPEENFVSPWMKKASKAGQTAPGVDPRFAEQGEGKKLRKAPALPPVLYALVELRGLLRSEHEGKSGGWANGVLHAEHFVEDYARELKENAPYNMETDDEMLSSVACILRTLEVRIRSAARPERNEVRAGMMNAADLAARMRQDLEREPVEKRPGYERTEHVAPDA